jgi:hypothetical protein
MSESSELEDDGIMERTAGQNHDRDRERDRERERDESRTRTSSESSRPSSKGKGRLVDINLNSTIDEEPPESLANLSPELDADDPPVPFQPFRSASKSYRHSAFLPMETDEATQMLHPRPSSMAESVPPTVILPTEEPPKHDAFWASLFIISHAAMIAAFVLVWFQTSTPRTPIGDTVYSAIRASTGMLLWDTLFAIVIALVLFALLRNYVRQLIFAMLVIVPVLLATFSLYPFISSFQGASNGTALQDKVMRWFSLLPANLAVFWTYSIIRNRRSLDQAIQILEFSVKILTATPFLIVLGFTTLAAVVLTSWTWLLMFERVFLSGHLSSSGTKTFILSANSWWLGAYFVLQLLWALSVIAGIQRTTTAAVVSQWYFHRLAVPQPSSAEVVKASFLHATGALFGTVCLSTFLSLLIRLPLIILPGRLSGVLGMCAYWVIPSGLATLTNPLTLTYSAIHSQPLGIGARGLASLNLTSKTNPSNTLGRNNFNTEAGTNTLLPYRLAKLLLQATRWIASIALGFGGWVRVAHSMKIDGIRGSMYAYVVALMAGTLGFAVLGAIENVLGAVLDASVVCWASESAGGRGEARFCREAGELFGDGDERFTLGDRAGMV